MAVALKIENRELMCHMKEDSIHNIRGKSNQKQENYIFILC